MEAGVSYKNFQTSRKYDFKHDTHRKTEGKLDGLYSNLKLM